MMYCVSIGFKDFNKALEVISNYEMAEIRLDLCEFDRRQVKEIFATHNNLIATFRKNNRIADKYRESILKTAIVYGAAWLDLDMLDNDKEFVFGMKNFVRDYNRKLILSIHDYDKTPSIATMEKYIEYAKKFEPDLIKTVFFSQSEKDNERVLSLHEKHKNIIAFNMGEKGKATRIKSLQLGAPFIYVAHDSDNTAPGQMTMEEIKKYPTSSQ